LATGNVGCACQPFETTAAGYRKLLEWLQGFGEVCLVGVEGTGSYGATLGPRRSTRCAV